MMFGLGIGRRLPSPALRLLHRCTQFVRENRRLPSPFASDRPRRHYSGQDVIVAGLFSTRSGLGRGARLLVDDLRSRGVRAHAVDLSKTLRLPVDLPAGGAISPAAASSIPATDIIVVANPPMFHEAILKFDRAWLQDRCVVAHWVWELSVLPPSWQRSAAACDEIWAPSPFVAEAVRSSLPAFGGPVRVVPYPVDRDPFEPVTAARRSAVRQRLGFAADTFCVGYSFSTASNFSRKNPEAVVEAFRQAFPPGERRARLVLRALDLATFPPAEARLRGMADRDPRIRVFDGRHEKLPLEDFYAAIDLYLALHRAEGYGLNLVEASQAGKVVLATGWGLDPEIAKRPSVEALPYSLVPVVDPQGHYSGSNGALWAEPDIAAAAGRLRDHARRTLSAPPSSAG